MRTPTSRLRRAFPALLGAAALSLTVLPNAASADHTDTSDDGDLVTSVRWNGDTRYDTASKLAVEGSSAAVSTPATAAVLATGENFPDALAGAYLSGVVGGPILLTEEAQLSDATRERLTSDEASGLGEVETIYLLGGRDAIDAAVEDELEDLGYGVVRIGGDTRIETAAMVATQVADTDATGEVDGMATAIVATAGAYPDALVAGAAARNGSLPLLLTETDELPDFTLDALQELEVEQVLLPGGEVAISQDVEDALNEEGYETVRIAGDTRRSTAVAFADFNAEKLGFTRDEVAVARGDFYADALTVSPFAGREGFSVLLTESPDSLGLETSEYLNTQASCTFDTLYVPGGPVAVSADVEQLAREALTTDDDCAAVDNEDPTLSGAYVVTAEDADPTLRELPQPGDDVAYAIFDEDVTGDDALPQQFTHIAADGTRTDATSVEFDGSEQVLLGFPDGTLTPGEGQVAYKQAGDPTARVYDLAGNDATNDVVVDVTEETTVDSTEDVSDAAPGDGECATESGDCTLRAAVQESNADPDFDVINVEPGTYALTVAGADEDAALSGDLDITESVRIVGLAGSGTTIVDAEGLEDRIFDVHAGDVAIEGLTLANGAPIGESDRGGAVRVTGEGTTLNLAASAVEGSSAPQAGGGLENTGAVVHVSGTTFDANATGEQPGNGGGIHAEGGETHVTESTFTANTAVEGGALWLTGMTSVVDSTIEDNDATASGTAIHNESGSLALEGVTATSDATLLGSDVTSGITLLAQGDDATTETAVGGNVLDDGQADANATCSTAIGTTDNDNVDDDGTCFTAPESADGAGA